MDEKTSELIRLFDSGSVIVQEARSKAGGHQTILIDNLTRLSANLERLKQAAIEGKLPRQSYGDVEPGTGLALTRTVGEWSTDPDLYDALFRVEEFYRHEF